MSGAAWPRIEAAFDDLLDLPPAERPAALDRLAGGDQTLLTELRRLLEQTLRGVTWLDRPAADSLAEPPPPSPIRLEPGLRIGAYRIVGFIGQGGMGEVYRAERADGQFDRQVALKLIRPDAIWHVERFLAERRILARLDHPGITRILDGGLLDGQPYMVMELVRGQSITAWCRDRQLPLEARLRLFLDVCDAVAYAHRNLIVHRDIKPANVLVTEEGAVKLLDFGIAKLLVSAYGDETRFAPLTPSHAAPEQLAGEPVSTATDTYALGMLLFDLLAGAPPWDLSGLPMAVAIRTVLEKTPPPLSQVGGRALAGDLDAIVAKALRKEPAHRYGVVDALKLDIERSLAGEPVSARAKSRLYVAGRFIRRHRLPIAAGALVSVALIGGLAGATWQYLRADREAARANTIKTFVISLYADNDPAFPKDKLRRDVTAEMLLDLGVARIPKEFADSPDLEAELYDMTGGLYDSLGDPDRAARAHEKAVAVARQAFGDSHPLVLNAQLRESWFALGAGELDKARQILGTLDRVIRESGQDNSAYRARWWINQAQLLGKETGGAAAQREALDHALAIFARYAPAHPFHVSALQNAGIARVYEGDYAGAADLYQKALDLWYRLPKDQRSERDLVYVLANRAGALLRLGQLDEARQSYEQAAEMALAVSGQSDPYWMSLSRVADLLHKQGHSAEAMARYDALIPLLPPVTNGYAEAILMRYADALTADGRTDEAIAILEKIRAAGAGGPPRPREERRLHFSLGLAYEKAGRSDEARTLLEKALKEYAADPKSQEYYDLRGRWAWLLLKRGETEAAAAAFDAIIRDEAEMSASSTSPALAWAGRARLASQSGDAEGAKAASANAFIAYDKVKALHDVRDREFLQLSK